MTSTIGYGNGKCPSAGTADNKMIIKIQTIGRAGL
jgi:hypothetical protein